VIAGLFEPERVKEVVQLPDEEAEGPEVVATFRQVGGAAVAYLVVEDDLPPVAGEVGQREQLGSLPHSFRTALVLPWPALALG
jgi:hypothetical protein